MAQEADPLQLSDYAGMVWTRKLYILALAVLMAISAAAVSALQTPMYTSTAEFTLTQRQIDTNLNSETKELSDTAMATEAALLTSDDVAARAVQRGATSKPTAQTTTKTNLIALTATAASPTDAATTANAYVDAYVELRAQQEATVEEATIGQLNTRAREIQQQIDDTLRDSGPDASGAVLATLSGLQQQQTAIQGQLSRSAIDRAVPGLTTNVVQRAVPATDPISPNPLRDALVAVVLAIFLGTAVSVLLGTLKVRRQRGENAGVPGPGSTNPNPNGARRPAPLPVQAPKQATPSALEVQTVRLERPRRSPDDEPGQITSAEFSRGV